MTERVSSRYTRREFGSLVLKAGAGAALAASLPEIRTARSDGEAQPEVPEASFCENPVFKNEPEISIGNQRLYGIKVCFRDQPEGVKEAEQNAGFYDEGLTRLFKDMIDNGILKRYMRIDTSYEILPGIYWSKYDFAEHRARKFNELTIEGLPNNIWYDGNIYPIVFAMYFTDGVRQNPANVSPEFLLWAEYGARGEYSGGRVRGSIQFPWSAADPQEAERWYDITTLDHERGHAIGMGGHSRNKRSLMYSAGATNPILDVNDVSRMCTYKVYLPIGHGPQIP